MIIGHNMSSKPTYLSFAGIMLLTFKMIFFFFQAEDGIRDTSVTGVQTCALPICPPRRLFPPPDARGYHRPPPPPDAARGGRLELRPPVGERADAAAPPVGLRRRLYAGGGGGSHWRLRSEERRVGKEGRCEGWGGG